MHRAFAILANNDGLDADLVELNYYDWIVHWKSNAATRASRPQRARLHHTSSK
jgi:hypothetical protein